MPSKRLTRGCRVAAIVLGATAALPASAADLVIGGYKHAVYSLPTSKNTEQGGYDIQLGLRFDPILALHVIGGPAPYLIGSINTRGGSSFGGAGLAWKIGAGPVYFRPGLGLVVQSQWHKRFDGNDRIDLGSPVLFEPELGIGVHVAPRVAIEANWTHISHAMLFSHQNPGLDMLGLRLVLHLP